MRYNWIVLLAKSITDEQLIENQLQDRPHQETRLNCDSNLRRNSSHTKSATAQFSSVQSRRLVCARLKIWIFIQCCMLACPSVWLNEKPE